YDVGWQAAVQDTDAFLCCVYLPVPDCRTYRHYAFRRAVQLATEQLVLCCCAFPLRDRWRDSLHHFWRLLLLVSENDRSHVPREARQAPFLAVRDRVPFDVRPHARSWHSRHAAPHLYIRARSGMGHLEFAHHNWRFFSDHCHACLHLEPCLLDVQG